MKKNNFKQSVRAAIVVLCLAAIAAGAQAQKVSCYSEVYNERTGELKSKEWNSADGYGRQEHPDGTIAILRADSMKMYYLNPANKTARALPYSQVNTNDMLGRKLAASSDYKREFVRHETVEGYECAVYTVTRTKTLTTGDTEASVNIEWVYEPLGMWIRLQDDTYGAIATRRIRRNIVQGSQPAHLFEIPRDYKVITIPAGGLMEMMTGMKQTEQQKDKSLDKDDLLDMVTGGNKEAAEKMQEVLKQIEKLNKKK